VVYRQIPEKVEFSQGGRGLRHFSLLQQRHEYLVMQKESLLRCDGEGTSRDPTFDLRICGAATRA
jgi:hypothetical protein